MWIKEIWHYSRSKITEMIKNERGQFALDIALGLAVVLIISAFIVMPGLRTLSSGFMTSMTTWWNTTMSGQIFRTTGN